MSERDPESLHTAILEGLVQSPRARCATDDSPRESHLVDETFARMVGALARSEANLRTAQALARLGSFEFSVPHKDDSFWSEETFHILGLPYSPSPMDAREYVERLVHPEDRAATRLHLETAIREGGSLDHTYRIVRPDLSERWVRTHSGPPLRLPDGRQTFVGTIQDVTAMKHAESIREGLEARLRQSQKLEAVGTLAGGIAHDFNNILSALTGYAELALAATAKGTQVQADLEQVIVAARRATDLVSRLLAFSRQQDRRSLRTSLAGPIHESVRLLRATLPSSIGIEETVADDAPEVLADETQLVQVILNLGMNAVHAMDARRGVLRIELSPFHVDPEFAATRPHLAPGPHAVLSVSDTGRGIEPHLLDRVLEPFFTTKPPGVGTGLGLSVVHGIVREHGGALELESRAGVGTTVRIYLPAARADARSEPPARLPDDVPAGRGERLLLVDDEPALAELERRRLEDLGYAVVSFSDAPTALHAFRRAPAAFDVVVTDQSMPSLSGIELARELRRLRADLPILLVSGHGDAASPDVLRSAGIRRVLAKPLSIHALAHAVREALEEGA